MKVDSDLFVTTSNAEPSRANRALKSLVSGDKQQPTKGASKGI